MKYIMKHRLSINKREGVYTIDLSLTDEEKEPFMPKPQEDVLE